MSDTEIVDLDDPEPTAARGPRRVGSIVVVAASALVVAAIVALVYPRPANVPTVEVTPAPTSVFTIITAPPATVRVETPIAVTVPTDRAVAEVLEGERWTSLGSPYPARGDVAEAVLYGDIYVIGGTGTTEDGRNVFRYDAKTGARQRAPDLPISLDHAMAAALNGRIYVFGGFVFGQASARVFSLGANDASWTEESLLPQGRAAGGAAVLNGRIWLVGGVSLNGTWISDLWSWDGNGRWSSGFALMPTPRDHLAVGTYRGSICAAGGNGGPQAFECYEPVRNEWTKRPDLRRPVLAGRAAEAAGWFWVVDRDVHVFTVDRWQFGPALQSPRAGGALITIGEALYFLEGATGRAAPIEMLRPRP